MRLTGKAGIVTGGAQGIGRAYSERLASEDAAVAVLDLRRDQAAAVAAGIRESGGRATALTADVTDQEQMNQAVAQVVKEFGRIDFIINNAAIYYDLDRTDTSIDYLRKVLDVNLIGIIICARAVFPVMKQQRSGSIVNISSSAAWPKPPAIAQDLNTVPVSGYALSKSGVIFLTKSMAGSLGQYNIRVNAIAPGVTMSEATKKVVPGHIVDAMTSASALGRTLQPTDLAGVAAFLVSDDSALMTGQTLACDAGVNMLG